MIYIGVALMIIAIVGMTLNPKRVSVFGLVLAVLNSIWFSLSPWFNYTSGFFQKVHVYLNIDIYLVGLFLAGIKISHIWILTTISLILVAIKWYFIGVFINQLVIEKKTKT